MTAFTHFSFAPESVDSYVNTECGISVHWSKVRPLCLDKPEYIAIFLSHAYVRPKCPTCVKMVLEQMNPLDLLNAAEL